MMQFFLRNFVCRFRGCDIRKPLRFKQYLGADGVDVTVHGSPAPYCKRCGAVEFRRTERKAA